MAHQLPHRDSSPTGSATELIAEDPRGDDGGLHRPTSSRTSETRDACPLEQAAGDLVATEGQARPGERHEGHVLGAAVEPSEIPSPRAARTTGGPPRTVRALRRPGPSPRGPVRSDSPRSGHEAGPAPEGSPVGKRLGPRRGRPAGVPCGRGCKGRSRGRCRGTCCPSSRPPRVRPGTAGRSREFAHASEALSQESRGTRERGQGRPFESDGPFHAPTGFHEVPQFQVDPSRGQPGPAMSGVECDGALEQRPVPCDDASDGGPAGEVAP